MRAIARALASMRSGFLVAAGNGITSPPAAVTRGASRPPGSASTSARPPARTTASAISTSAELGAAGVELRDDLQYGWPVCATVSSSAASKSRSFHVPKHFSFRTM